MSETKVITTPDGAGQSAIAKHKKRMAKKPFQNFQTTQVLKLRLEHVRKTHNINISEFFRKCSEILIDAANQKDAIVDINKLANAIVFKRKRRKKATS